MNNTISDREELLLAKIAGKDVDIKTMKPGVATSLKEKLMLDIADRIDELSNGQDGEGGRDINSITRVDNEIVIQYTDGNTDSVDIGGVGIIRADAATSALFFQVAGELTTSAFASPDTPISVYVNVGEGALDDFLSEVGRTIMYTSRSPVLALSTSQDFSSGGVMMHINNYISDVVDGVLQLTAVSASFNELIVMDDVFLVKGTVTWSRDGVVCFQVVLNQAQELTLQGQ